MVSYKIIQGVVLLRPQIIFSSLVTQHFEMLNRILESKKQVVLWNLKVFTHRTLTENSPGLLSHCRTRKLPSRTLGRFNNTSASFLVIFPRYLKPKKKDFWWNNNSKSYQGHSLIRIKFDGMKPSFPFNSALYQCGSSSLFRT